MRVVTEPGRREPTPLQRVTVRTMDCVDSRLSCQLARIADELGGFDWEGVISTFAATLVGALLAAIVAWLVFRGESNERYAERMTDAVESLSTAMSRTARDFVRWQEELIDFFSLPEPERERRDRPEEPDRVALDVGLDMLIARARGADRVTAQQIREVAYQLAFIQDGRWAEAEYATLRRVIVAWRAGRRSQTETRASLATMDERRSIAEKMSSVDESKLPAAPEKYQRTDVG